ncbi:DinB family protein [Paracnuella aquatica]|uniref:DinB family protein n=1 Tax=Paracnuella aquatica TaxID=2268757 RepID=UPI000DEFEF85|nr:DinB family protein [Paracnuella aquatica]RPD44179.1 DinB family protein [Paracnuella aquatica]
MMDELEDALMTWKNALADYNEAMLLQKPALNSWSMGQLYMHLVAETSFYLTQVDACLRSPQNSDQQPTAEGKAMLAANSFPDMRIEGPPTNALVQQPADKAQLIAGFDDLLKTLQRVNAQAANSLAVGKTAHPGLGFLNAAEWAQFAAMHLRHHLRQKARIDSFLATHAGETEH